MTNLEPSMSQLSEWRRPRPALKDRSLLQHLFNRLDGAYPGRFRAAFTNPDSIENWEDTWESGFLRESIAPAEVAAALERLPAGWPPDLPAFLVLCRPAMQPEVAFHEAVAGLLARRARGERGDWSHPAIYWAAVRITEHEMMAHGYQALKGRWENALRDILGKGRWAEIPMPAKALPRPGAVETTSEDGLRRIADLGAASVVRAAPTGRAVGWAQKIIEKDQSGRRRPPIAVLAMARRALRQEAEENA